MSAFNKNLVALRKAAGISQKNFAQMLDIPITTLSGYENGGREPKFDLLIKMSALLNVPVDDFLKDDLSVKFHVPERDKFLSKMSFNLMGDSLIITIPRDEIERMILLMQLAADFLNMSASIYADREGDTINKRFFLKISDGQDTKGDNENDND